jgi:uncharacterized protein YjiS (DUF1127 family)
MVSQVSVFFRAKLFVRRLPKSIPGKSLAEVASPTDARHPDATNRLPAVYHWARARRALGNLSEAFQRGRNSERQAGLGNSTSTYQTIVSAACHRARARRALENLSKAFQRGKNLQRQAGLGNSTATYQTIVSAACHRVRARRALGNLSEAFQRGKNSER